MVARTGRQPLGKVFDEAHVEVCGCLLQVAVWLGEHWEVGEGAVSVDFDAGAGGESVLVASNDCLTISQADSPVELHDGHASQSSRCCCFGIRGLAQLWMRSIVGQCYYAVDAAVKVLHLLRWNSVCLRILHKAVHADHELGGCEDHLLRLNVQWPDLGSMVSGLPIPY